jgi:predicted Rossmann fold flavoprotein
VQVKRIVVVGAGPAGMMAALRAAQMGSVATLVEKNPILGKKLLLSGKGRCNLTNACDLDSFLKRFSRNGHFLRDAFKKFFNADLVRFFETRGLKLKVERQQRVFPATDRSESIRDILEKELRSLGVKILCKSRMKDLLLESGKVRGLLLDNGQLIPADRVILATGGVSYAFTGSTGEGLECAKRIGHRVTALRPGLVAMETREKYPNQLLGLTLKNIRLAFSDGKREIISDIGELLFTPMGVSGPLVLTHSGAIADWIMAGARVFMKIDLKPGLSREQLDARLRRDFLKNARKTIKNSFKDLLPQKLAGVVLFILKVDPNKKVSQITKIERENIVSLLKGFRLNIAKPGPLEEAMVTRGGISLKEIDPRSMQSRLCPGLYFCGEMIDVDADTGGFNLQAAFSTGYLAGESAALS